MEQKNPLPNIPEPTQMPVNPQINSSSFKKPFLIVFLVVLLVVLSSLGTYLFVKSQTVSPTPIITPTPTVSASLIPSAADETANWKTYGGTNVGYSLKYPPSWSVKNFGNDITLNSDDQLHYIRVQQFIIPQNLTLEKFIYNDGLGENYGKAYLDGNKINLTFKNTSQHPIYNTLNPSNWGSANGILIRFIQDQGTSNKYAWFGLEPYNQGGTPIPLEKEHENIYYQILSTFKFLDQNQTDPTANWKIYTNTKYGYVFKYPETFSLVKGPASNQPVEYFTNLASVSFSGMSKNSDQNAGVVFGITVKPTNSEGQPITCSTNNECLQAWMKILNSTTNQVSYINISNQRIQGFEYQTSNKLYKQNNSYYVFPEKGKIWLISLTANNYIQQEVAPVFDQIISTFKFN